MAGVGAGAGGTASMPSMPPPRPKSPPQYPDLYGKRREFAKVQMLEREIGFLEEELKSIEGLHPASRSCKEVTEFVSEHSDPLIPTIKKTRRSCCFWKWLCGSSCFNLSWICCWCRCPSMKMPNCNLCNCCPYISCSIPKCQCFSCPRSKCCRKPVCKWSCCSLKCPSCFSCSSCSSPCTCTCSCSCSYPRCPKLNCSSCCKKCCCLCPCYLC